LPVKRHTPEDDTAAADKFKEATGAYEVLSDDGQRRRYDAYGHRGGNPGAGFDDGDDVGGEPFAGFGGFHGFSRGDGSFHSQQGIDVEDLFEAFASGSSASRRRRRRHRQRRSRKYRGDNRFAGFEGFQGFSRGDGSFYSQPSNDHGSHRRRRKRRPRKGEDLQMEVCLTFHEAVRGAAKDVHLQYLVYDKQGRTRVKERDVGVDIPAGIDDGMSLRLAGQGAEGDPGAPRGDLLVRVSVDEDGYFRREGTDVHTECPFSFAQAVLGGTADVETLSGVVEVTIPRGTQEGTKLVLRGEGVPHLHSRGTRRGHHVVHLRMEIPKHVSSLQEELLREFDAHMEPGGVCGRLSEAAGSVSETSQQGEYASNQARGKKKCRG